MDVLTSAMSILSVFHPDANPALRGQDLNKSKQVRDKQILRILRKEEIDKDIENKKTRPKSKVVEVYEGSPPEVKFWYGLANPRRSKEEVVTDYITKVKLLLLLHRN